jgi:hypothetical protein
VRLARFDAVQRLAAIGTSVHELLDAKSRVNLYRSLLAAREITKLDPELLRFGQDQLAAATLLLADQLKADLADVERSSLARQVRDTLLVTERPYHVAWTGLDINSPVYDGADSKTGLPQAWAFYETGTLELNEHLSVDLAGREALVRVEALTGTPSLSAQGSVNGVFDPEVAVADAYVVSGNPTQNGGGTAFYVGHDTNPVNGTVYESFVRFDLSPYLNDGSPNGVEGATVTLSSLSNVGSPVHSRQTLCLTIAGSRRVPETSTGATGQQTMALH